MQILKVYDNGPPAMEVGTTHKYELKDKDRFRLTARPKLCNIWKGQNKRAVTVMHPNYPAVCVIFLSWRSSRKSVHCRCHLILTMMALVFLGGGTLLTALSFQVLVPSEEKKSSCMVVFFYCDRGVEIINEMTLKHCHRDFFACFNQITSELVSTNFCSGAVILFSTNAPNLSSSHTTSLEISQPPFASSS